MVEHHRALAAPQEQLCGKRSFYNRKNLDILLRVVTSPRTLNPPPGGFLCPKSGAVR